MEMKENVSHDVFTRGVLVASVWLVGWLYNVFFLVLLLLGPLFRIDILF